MVPALVTRSVIRPAGTEGIDGITMNSDNFTSTTVTASPLVAPDDAEVSLRNPNNDRQRAAIATANAPQPNTDRSCVLMETIVWPTVPIP